MEVKDKLSNILVSILKVPSEEVDFQCEIYESNLISSMGLLELVSQIEKTFQIVVLSEELIHENFSTGKHIENFILTKLSERIQ